MEFPGIDLEPEEIESLLADDREACTQLIGELHDAGVEALKAVDAFDVDALLLVAEDPTLNARTVIRVTGARKYGSYWIAGDEEGHDRISGPALHRTPLNTREPAG